MGWPLGLNASSSSLPLPQVGDGFTPAIPTNSKPANATPTDQTDFKQQRPELLGQILEMQRFMSNLAIEQPDHWLNWGIAQLQKKKTSTQLLEKGALSLDELAEKLAIGKIGVLEARKQFRQILKENNLNFEKAVNQEAGVFENLAFGAKQIETLSETGTQLILSRMLGAEMGFIGSGVFRIINSGLKKASLIASERGQPIVSKTVLVETLKEIMAGEEWKQDFQETTQLYLTQKLGQNIPPKLGKIISSGAIYAGSDIISQVLSNLMEGKQPFESFDKDSVFISLVCGLVGGVLGIKLEKAQFGEFPQILVEAGYDGIAGLVQEMILARRDGRTLDFKQGLEIFIQEFGGEIAGVHSAQSHNKAKQAPVHQEGQIWNDKGEVVGHTNGSDFKLAEKPTKNINPSEVTVDVKAEPVTEEKNNIIPLERKTTTATTQAKNNIVETANLREIQVRKKAEQAFGEIQAYLRYLPENSRNEIQAILEKNGLVTQENKALVHEWLSLIPSGQAKLKQLQKILNLESIKPDSLASIHVEMKINDEKSQVEVPENTLASVDENKQNTIKPEIVFLNEYNDWKIQTREDGNPDLKLVNLLKGQPTDRFVRPFSTLEYIKELSNGHKISIWLPANISDWGTISIKGKDGKAQTQRPSEETIKELSKKLLEQIDNSLANIPDSEKCFLKVLAISPFPVNLQRYRGGRICADRTLVENSNIKTNAVVKFFVGSELSLAEGISNNHYLKYWIMPNLIHEIGHIRDYANGNSQNIKNVIEPNDVYKSDSSFEDFRIRRTEYLNYTKQHYIINALRVDMRYRQTIKEGTLLGVRSIMETAIRGSKSLKSQDEIDNFLLSWKKQIVAIIPRNTLSNSSRLAYEQKFEKLRGILDNTRLGKTPEDKALEMSQELINELWEEVDFLRITNYGSTQPGEAIAEAYNYYWRAKSASKNGDNKSLHWLQTLYPVTFNLFEEEFNNTNKTQDLQSPAQSEKVNSINNTPQNLSNNPEAGYFILSGLKPKVPPLMEAVLKLPVLGKNPKSEYFPNFPTFKNWLGLSSKQVSNNNNTPKTQTENPTEITQNNTQEETVSDIQARQEEAQINPNNSQNSSANTQNTPKIAKSNIGSDDFIRSLEKQNPQKAKYLEYILNKHPELKESLNNTEVQKNLEEVELHEGTTSDYITYNLKLIQSILPTALEIKLNETLEKELVREVNNINQQDIKEIKNFLQLIKINNPATYDVLLFVLNNNKAIIYKLTETEVQKNLDELDLSSSNEDEVLLQNLNSIKKILGLEINNINTPASSNWVDFEDTWNFADEPLVQALGLENTDLDPVIRKIQLNYKNLPETVQKKLNNPDRSEVTTELIAQALREKTINPKITVYTLEELIDETNKLESNTKKAETIREFGGLIKYLNNPNIQIAKMKLESLKPFIETLARLDSLLEKAYTLGLDYSDTGMAKLQLSGGLFGFGYRAGDTRYSMPKLEREDLSFEKIASWLKINKDLISEGGYLSILERNIQEYEKIKQKQFKEVIEKLNTLYPKIEEVYEFLPSNFSKEEIPLREIFKDIRLLKSSFEKLELNEEILNNLLNNISTISYEISSVEHNKKVGNRNLSELELQLINKYHQEIKQIEKELNVKFSEHYYMQNEKLVYDSGSMISIFHKTEEKMRKEILKELEALERKYETKVKAPAHKTSNEKRNDTETFEHTNRYRDLSSHSLSKRFSQNKQKAIQLDYEIMTRLDMISKHGVPKIYKNLFDIISGHASNANRIYNFVDTRNFNQSGKKLLNDLVRSTRKIIFESLSIEEKLERQGEFRDLEGEELVDWINKNNFDFIPTLLDVFYCRIINNDKDYNSQKLIPVDRTKEVTKFRATIENRVRKHEEMVDFAISFLEDKIKKLDEIGVNINQYPVMMNELNDLLTQARSTREYYNLENYLYVDFSEFNELDNNEAKKLFIEIKNLLGIDLENTYKTKTNLNKLLELKSSLDSSLEHTKLILKLQINFEGVDISQIQKELSRLLIQIDIIAKAPNTETIVDDTDKLISEINNCLLDFNKIVKNKSLKISFDNTLEQLIIEKKSIIEQLKEAHPDKHLNLSEEGQDDLLERTKQLIDELSKIKDRINEFKKLESLLD